MNDASNATTSRSARRHAGFTLIELLIAISLMAVLAVLGWRGLDSVLMSRERIVVASDSLRGLSVGFAQIDEDLRRAWSVRLLNLSVPVIWFVEQGAEAPPAMQLLRELPPGTGASQVQRIIYRLRDGVFERGFFPWVMPTVQRQAPVSEDAVTWQPLLSGVTRLQMRAWVGGQGWVPASGLAQRGGAAASNIPVTGLEVLVERGPSERIVRVFAVKD